MINIKDLSTEDLKRILEEKEGYIMITIDKSLIYNDYKKKDSKHWKKIYCPDNYKTMSILWNNLNEQYNIPYGDELYKIGKKYVYVAKNWTKKDKHDYEYYLMSEKEEDSKTTFYLFQENKPYFKKKNQVILELYKRKEFMYKSSLENIYNKIKEIKHNKEFEEHKLEFKRSIINRKLPEAASWNNVMYTVHSALDDFDKAERNLRDEAFDLHLDSLRYDVIDGEVMSHVGNPIE